MKQVLYWRPLSLVWPMNLTVIWHFLLGACELIYIFICKEKNCNNYPKNIGGLCTKHSCWGNQAFRMRTPDRSQVKQNIAHVTAVIIYKTPQTEIPTLLDSWGTNMPFVKMFFQKDNTLKCWSINGLPGVFYLLENCIHGLWQIAVWYANLVVGGLSHQVLELFNCHSDDQHEKEF